MSFRGWPDFIEVALANLRRRSEAFGPRAPVASKPNGMKSHPDWAQRVEWVDSFRASAASAADVASPRAAELEESRSGWEMVTSTASGRGPKEAKSKSAGRSWEDGRGTSN